MSPETIAAVVFGLIVLTPIVILVIIKLPKKMKTDVFMTDWQQIQACCKDKAEWPKAITKADALLDRALKRRKFKGKSMGERMVNAQKLFTNNDSTWFAHNLAKKLTTDNAPRLKEADVKMALIGFRQALRDIGALDNGQSKDS